MKIKNLYTFSAIERKIASYKISSRIKIHFFISAVDNCLILKLLGQSNEI